MNRHKLEFTRQEMMAIATGRELHDGELAIFGVGLSMLAGLLNVSITWLISAEGSGIEDPEKLSEVPDHLQESLKELTALRVNLLKNVERIDIIENKLKASGKIT